MAASISARSRASNCVFDSAARPVGRARDLARGAVHRDACTRRRGCRNAGGGGGRRGGGARRGGRARRATASVADVRRVTVGVATADAGRGGLAAASAEATAAAEAVAALPTSWTAVVVMLSLSFAPTWKVKPEDCGEQLVAVELRLVGDLVDLLGELAHLGDDRVLVGAVERVVLVLHLQVAHSLQHRVDLVEGAFRRLDQRHAVLRVALGLGEATDLGAHLLGDGQAGGVVGRAVDAVAGRQLLHRLGSLGRGARQLAVGVESLNVVLDTKAHDHLSLMNWFVGGRGDSMSPLYKQLDRPGRGGLERRGRAAGRSS